MRIYESHVDLLLRLAAINKFWEVDYSATERSERWFDSSINFNRSSSSWLGLDEAIVSLGIDEAIPSILFGSVADPVASCCVEAHPMLGRTIGFVVLKSAGTECEKILRNCALC
eukprot:Selendium_serpulae@DN6433_c0_g1_i6.p1